LFIDEQSIFFSYCREDSDIAQRLVASLKAAGADVWIDRLNIEPGLQWDATVEDALRRCSILLVVLSPAAVASANVRDEVSFALSERKRIIPILHRDCEVPFQLGRLQRIDFRSGYGSGLNSLLKTLNAFAVPKETHLSTAATDQRRPPARKMSEQTTSAAPRKHRLMAKPGNFTFYPVILAGGRGTRFWPWSRKRMAKQLLPLNSNKSMIHETVSRLRPLAKAKQFWIITNTDLRDPIALQLKGLDKHQIIAEPVGRNTAPAIGLAAFLLARRDPEAVIGIFPSDHVIVDEESFREDIRLACEIAASGENIVVIGIPPTRAETGYGYIETSAQAQKGVLQVRRFTEKPARLLAEQFLKTRNYFWNSGMFIWSARTLVNAMHEHLPLTAPLLEEIAASYGTRRFESTFSKLYPKCENISIDYAVLEPRSAKGDGKSGIYCIPARFGWNDLGSWAALYEQRSSGKDGENVIHAQRSFTLNAKGNFIDSKQKFVAVVGVNDLVVVETNDALLITTREQAQDVGKIVEYLDQEKLTKLV
jgi:mannose-1-phosphate guanylyltransferase